MGWIKAYEQTCKLRRKLVSAVQCTVMQRSPVCSATFLEEFCSLVHPSFEVTCLDSHALLSFIPQAISKAQASSKGQVEEVRTQLEEAQAKIKALEARVLKVRNALLAVSTPECFFLDGTDLASPCCCMHRLGHNPMCMVYRYTVFLAEKSQNIRSYTVYIYSYGQSYACTNEHHETQQT